MIASRDPNSPLFAPGIHTVLLNGNTVEGWIAFDDKAGWVEVELRYLSGTATQRHDGEVSWIAGPLGTGRADG